MTAPLWTLPVAMLLAYWLGREVEHRSWLRVLGGRAKNTGHTSAAEWPDDPAPVDGEWCPRCVHDMRDHAPVTGCGHDACSCVVEP